MTQYIDIFYPITIDELNNILDPVFQKIGYTDPFYTEYKIPYQQQDRSAVYLSLVEVGHPYMEPSFMIYSVTETSDLDIILELKP